MKNITNGDMPATPVTEIYNDGSVCCQHLGMTKRETYALAAMQGFCANSTETEMLNQMMIRVDDHRSLIVEASVRMADLLLKELAKSSDKP